MPVARNVWQQVEEGSPAAIARRFTIRRTSVRVMPFVTDEARRAIFVCVAAGLEFNDTRGGMIWDQDQ